MTINNNILHDLRKSVKDCSERGLSFAAKWSSELLLSRPNIPPPNDPPSDIDTSSESDLLASALTYVQTKEFLRAVHLLRDCISPKARFISVYCQFMVNLILPSFSQLY